MPSQDTEPTDRELLADSYEALWAIYETCQDRSSLSQGLQDALARHEPLLGKLTERVAP